MPYPKSLLVVLALSVLVSCGKKQDSSAEIMILEKRIDTLEQQISLLKSANLPKLSVLMNRMQLHHSRLWEPGIRQNWKLSGYECRKLKETFDEINLLYGDQVHGTSNLKTEFGVLAGVIDSLNTAIKNQNKDDFVHSYQSLTLKCNNCHKKADLDFYGIISPKTPAYGADIE